MKALQPKLRNKMSAPGFGRRSLHRADQGVHQSASPESGVYSSCDIVSINITLSSKNNFGHLKRATWRNAVSSLAGSRLEFSRHLHMHVAVGFMPAFKHNQRILLAVLERGHKAHGYVHSGTLRSSPPDLGGVLR